MQHTQESSVWLQAEGRHARVLTSSLLRAYWDAGLAASMGWKQFHRIVRVKCKWAIRPSRKTDYCDYCHLFQSSIVPGLERLMAEASEALQNILPNYLNAYSPPQSADAIDQCDALSRYIRQHPDAKQAERAQALKRKEQQDLHELEAKIAHQMAWELKVAKSYQWHRLVATRQSQSWEAEVEGLTDGQVLLWSDYKQNLTVPMARTETGEMFYGTARMEMTCWGCLLFQRQGATLVTKHVIVLSSIIERSSLVSNLLYQEAAKHIGNFATVNEILVWADCGPHYKSYEHVAGWLGDWVESSTPRKVRLSYFGEKHGKGQVDGLFGRIEGWLKNYLKKPGSRIASIDEMESVLRAEATRAMSAEPGVQFVVVRWEPEQKPPTTWLLPSPEFQISKTYCLQLLPDNPRVHIRTTAIVDYTFSEMVGDGGTRSYPKVEQAVIKDRAWRRGYFSTKRWDRKPPEQGKQDSVMTRFEEHKRRKLEAPELENHWERSARKQANKLLRRRNRWQVMKATATGANNSSSSSSSSSSTSNSSGSA